MSGPEHHAAAEEVVSRSAGRATRHMCAGAYIDRSFRHLVLRKVHKDANHRTAPSYGLRPRLPRNRRDREWRSLRELDGKPWNKLELVCEKSRDAGPRPSVTEKFEFIDAEYAVYQESDDEYVPSIVMSAGG